MHFEIGPGSTELPELAGSIVSLQAEDGAVSHVLGMWELNTDVYGNLSFGFYGRRFPQAALCAVRS